MTSPPKTTGERMVWAAAYAAAWACIRQHQRTYGPDRDQSSVAIQAADEAFGALCSLREIRDNEDFGPDVHAVIDPTEPA